MLTSKFTSLRQAPGRIAELPVKQYLDPRLTQLEPKKLPPLARTKDLLHVYGLRAKKNLSQNFLLNTGLLKGLVRAAGIMPGHRVIEVGPGPGNLSREILKQSPFELLTVEKDRRFLPLLEQLADSVLPGQMKILLGDVMDHDFRDIFGDPKELEKAYNLEESLPDHVFKFSRDWSDLKYPLVRVIGNLPFSVSTALLIKWLRHISLKESFWQYGRVPMLLTFQDEVAKRIVAEPAEQERSRLSLMVQNYCHIEYKFRISGKSFLPIAGVDTGVVRFHPRVEPYCTVPFKIYEKFIRNLFHHRNHTLEYNYRTLFPRDIGNKVYESFKRARVNPHIYPYMISNKEAARLCNIYWQYCQEWPSLYVFDYRASKKMLPESTLNVLKEAGYDMLE